MVDQSEQQAVPVAQEVTALLWLERAEHCNPILPTGGSPMFAAVAEEMEEYAEGKLARFIASHPRKSGEGAGEPFLDQLRRVNLARYEAWVEGADAGIMFDALELGGEVGELLNVVKKLEREERGWRGSRASPEDFADECADVLICLDKLARRKGVNLAAATIAKFNATSEKVDLPHRLSAIDATQTREAELLEALQQAREALEVYADPTGYTDNQGDQYTREDTAHPGCLAQATLDRLAALNARDAA